MVLPLYAQGPQFQKVSLQLEWKHQFEFAGFYAALEKGYYKEVNLDVEIKEYQSDVDTLSDVLNGVSTYGMSSSQLILERLNGKKIVHLASYFKQNALVLITRPSIHTVEDLRGKKIMAADKELENTSIAAMLHENQLTLKDIEMIPHSFTIEPFVKGEIDAMTAFVSNQPFLLDQNGTPYNILNPAEEGIYSYDVELFTSEEEAANYPERTKNFIRATRKGWEYALSHPEEIVDLIYDNYSKEKSKEALLYEAHVTARLMKTDLFQIGAVVPELIEHNTRMYVQLGMVEKNWNLEGFVFDNQPKETMFTQEEAFIKDHPVIRFSDNDWAPFVNINQSGYKGVFKATMQPSLKKVYQFNKDELQYLKDKKAITVCMAPDYMWLESLKDGKQYGVNKRFIEMIEQAVQLPVTIIPTRDWAHSLELVKRRECDLLSMVAPTVERREYLNFTSPYLEISLVLATTFDKSPLVNLHATVPMKVAVVKNYALNEIIKNRYKNFEAVIVDSVEEGLEKVINGEVDAFADTLNIIGYHLQERYSSKLKISGTFDEKLKLGFGVRNDDPVLCSIMQKIVEDISDEQKQGILNQWFSMTYEKEFDYILFWKLLGVVVVIVLLLINRQRELHVMNEALRKKVEEELVKSRDKDNIIFHQNKLAAMGEMIENIAHQWRQPLSQVNTAVMVLDGLLEHKKIHDHAIEEKLSEIETLTQYMSSTIDDFKNFFAPDKQKVLFSLEELIEKSLFIVKPGLKYHDICLDVQCEPDIFYEGYPNELRQALLVMLNNAKDVLLSRKIETPKIRVSTYRTEEQIVIEICDNAGGVDRNIITKIFDPYFTTKHSSQGTGLGLYISKVIILHNMQGHLDVVNNAEGACFSISLPSKVQK